MIRFNERVKENPGAYKKIQSAWISDSNQIENCGLHGTSTHIFLKTGLTVSGKRIIDYLHTINHKAAIELFSIRSPFLRISSYAFMESSLKTSNILPPFPQAADPLLKGFIHGKTSLNLTA
jgi:hypothetical protein